MKDSKYPASQVLILQGILSLSMMEVIVYSREVLYHFLVYLQGQHVDPFSSLLAYKIVQKE